MIRSLQIAALVLVFAALFSFPLRASGGHASVASSRSTVQTSAALDR